LRARLAFGVWTGGLLLGLGVGLCACQRSDDAAATDPAEAAQLAALGYVEWVEGEDDLSRAGVVHRDARAQPGLTLYKSRPAPEAHLIDLDGAVVHTWRAPPLDVTDWRSLVSRVYRRGNKVSWDHVEVQPGGDLLAIVKDRHLERIDWSSETVWRTPLKAHHDLDVAEDGRVLTLTQGLMEFEAPDGPITLVDNGVAILSSDGEVLREMSLAPLFGDRIPPERIAEIREAEAQGEGETKHTANLRDVFHANGLELLEADVPGLGLAGQLLVSVRELDLIATVDLDAPAIVWLWGPGELQRQHHPSVLPNGNVLVFDNGSSRGFSRVLEVDPASGEVVWEYRGSPPEAFFTNTRGGVQWLPGDHFLVAESNSGRAFEIDRTGTVLWEFLNPDVSHWQDKRGTFYRVERLTPERVAQLPLGPPAPQVAAAP